MNEDFITQIKEIADLSPHREQCGVICEGELIPLRNVHDDPTRHFMLDAREVVGLHSDKFTVWHTHTPHGFLELTDADVRMAKFIKRPMLMVRAGDGATDFYDPLTPLPYEGRTWRTYHRNCYTLLQDWYRQEWGTALPDFFMDSPHQFLGRSPSKFLAHARESGFVPIPHKAPSSLLIGDVVLSTEGEGEAWHCSVVVELLPYVKCLSQWVDRPSGYFPYRAIAPRVHSVWRYQ